MSRFQICFRTKFTDRKFCFASLPPTTLKYLNMHYSLPNGAQDNPAEVILLRFYRPTIWKPDVVTRGKVIQFRSHVRDTTDIIISIAGITHA